MSELAEALRAALDPAQLMRRSGLEPDPWQVAVLRSTAPRVLMLCSRQSGKSTVAAALALHTALYVPNALVLMVSPSLRQSQELFRKALTLYRGMGQAVPVEAESALRLELRNGSRIISLPGSESNVRGYGGVNLLVIDEARVEDDLYAAVRPMLATSNGRLVALGTPAGKRGWFHHEWTEGAGWERTRITATECPRISKAFLEEEKSSLGPWWYAQEYECQSNPPHYMGRDVSPQAPRWQSRRQHRTVCPDSCGHISAEVTAAQGTQSAHRRQTSSARR